MTRTEVHVNSLSHVIISKGYIAWKKKLVFLELLHALTFVAWKETSHPVPSDRIVLDVGVSANNVEAPCVSGSVNGQEWESQEPTFYRQDQQKEHSRVSW